MVGYTCVVKDLREMKVKRWRQKAVDGEEWATAIKKPRPSEGCRAKKSGSKQATSIAPPALTWGQLKCDGTRAEIRFRLPAKRTSQFKSAGASVQSTTGSRGVRINGSNTWFIMFRGSVKCAGYSQHSPVSSSLPHPCVTVCHQVSTGVDIPLNVPEEKFFK